MVHSPSTLRTGLSRVRLIAGFPSGLVISFFFSFYLLVNAITYFGGLAGWVWVLLPVAASTVITIGLVWRWQRRVATPSRKNEFDARDNRLAARRGVVVLVGLDSASPGTTFLRLLAETPQLEYLALITTSEDDLLGVTSRMLDTLVPVSGRTIPHGQVRVWGGNNAEATAEIESSVTRAVAWMARHGVHPSEIVVDVTKGRRSMEFGALIAADRSHVEVQYLAADWHHVDNKPRPGTEDFTLVRAIWNSVGADAQPMPTRV